MTPDLPPKRTRARRSNLRPVAPTDCVIGYLRVSTAEQARDGHGLDAQRAKIQEWAARKGWTVTWYVDEGVSGAVPPAERPEFARALADLAAGKCSALISTKLDRLSRSSLDFGLLAKRAEAEGWALVMLDIDMDMTTPVGKLIAATLAAVAEFERDLISQRTREGLAAAKAKGVRLGAARQIPDEVRARIATEYRDGLVMREIAAGLNNDGLRTPTGREWGWKAVQRVLDQIRADQAALL